MENSSVLNSWSKAETLKLIEEYKKRPLLYKLDHPNYLDLKSRSEALMGILNVLKPIKPTLTQAHIKKKLKTLRHQMGVEKKKIIEANATGKKLLNRPKLWCYNELKFLMDQINDDNTTCNATRLKNFKMKEVAYRKEMKIFQNKIIRSIDLMTKISANKVASKEEAFCQYLSTELKTLELEDSFEEFKISVMILLQNIKEKEKKTLAESKFVWRDCPSSAAEASSGFVNSDSILENTVQSSNYEFDECDEEIDIKCEPEIDLYD